MKTASRTLVKSPPEVWEQLDDRARMEGLMSALVGRATEVEVYERVAESKLAWKAGDEARIEVELAEKGWGTNVSVTVENAHEPTKLEGWLDAVLDELATPQKRPFNGMTEAPSGTLAKALSSTKTPEPALVASPVNEEPAAEEPVAEEPVAEEPVAEEPVVEHPVVENTKAAEPKAEPTPEPEPEPRRKKRFFGLL
jgi:cell division septation protein DedD